MTLHAFRTGDDLSRAIDDRCIAEGISKTQLIVSALEQYLYGVIQPVIQTDIDDRFQTLEGEIEEIKKQLGAIVKVSWKYFISEHPGKTIDELCEIARERYPDKPLKLMRDSLNRAMKNSPNKQEG